MNDRKIGRQSKENEVSCLVKTPPKVLLRRVGHRRQYTIWLQSLNLRLTPNLVLLHRYR